MLLFALLCGLHELLAARRWALGAAALLWAAAVPYAATWCFLVPQPAEAYQAALSFVYEPGWPVASVALYALFPAAATRQKQPAPAPARASPLP